MCTVNDVLQSFIRLFRFVRCDLNANGKIFIKDEKLKLDKNHSLQLDNVYVHSEREIFLSNL